MKICVVSDSHMKNERIIDVYEQNKNQCDVFFHCGDSQLPPHSPFMKGYLTVMGNNDFMYDYPEQIKKTIQGESFLVLHGHEQYVKFEMNTLYMKARQEGADFVLYGHTHIPAVDEYNDIFFINPGSLRYRSMGNSATYCIIDLDEKNICFYNVLTHEIIEKYSYEKS